MGVDLYPMRSHSLYRVFREECKKIREGVPYGKIYRYNPKHLYPELNGYGDNGHRKVGASVCPRTVSCQLTVQMHARPSVRYHITY
jgi:hypothetical protein